jgi:hypothetical protein
MADNNGWSLDPAPSSGWTLDPTPEGKQWTIDPLAPRPQTDLGKALNGIAPQTPLPEDTLKAVAAHPTRPPPPPIKEDETSIPSYLAHGLESGIASAGAMLGDAAEASNPVSAARNAWLDIKDAAHQLIGGTDPNAYLQTQADKDASTPFTRFSDQLTREAQDLGNTPDGQKYNQLRYATTDPSKSALLSPVRMIHDLLQSLPSTAAMATTVYLTRGAAAKAYGEAIAAGFSKEEALGIATKAAGRVATLAGALGEGTVGGLQQGEQQRQQTLGGDTPTSRIYQAMIKAGVDPKAAKQYVATESGKIAGAGAGIVDALTNALEGPILGKIISEGGPLAARVGKGFLTEGTQEAVQGAGEQLSQNAANKEYVDPKQKLADGVAENVLSSFAVGGLTGGLFSAVGGAHHETNAMDAGAPLVTPEDQSSPLPTDLIQQGKGTIATDLDTGAHNAILRGAGMPTVGANVAVSRGPLGTASGTVQGAFSVSDDAGTQHGIRIGMDDGSTYEELFKDIQSGGHSINELIDKYLPEANYPAENITPNITAPSEGRNTVTAPKGNRSLPADVIQGLIAEGIPEHIARGAAAGVVAEASNNENAINSTSGAIGLGQWLGSRKQALIDRYGPNPTRAQQIQFLAWELKGGDPGGKAVLAAGDEQSALHAYITKFMRPAAGKEATGDLQRGLAALGGGTLDVASGEAPSETEGQKAGEEETAPSSSDQISLPDEEAAPAKAEEPSLADKVKGTEEAVPAPMRALDLAARMYAEGKRDTSGISENGDRYSFNQTLGAGSSPGKVHVELDSARGQTFTFSLKAVRDYASKLGEAEQRTAATPQEQLKAKIESNRAAAAAEQPDMFGGPTKTAAQIDAERHAPAIARRSQAER